MPSQMTSEIAARFRGLHRLIGNTPLLRIDYTFRGVRGQVFAKSENLNMTGSTKDRMAVHILQRAYERGTIRPGDRIFEATSGNTGISFAAVARALGHPVSIYMPNWMSSERVNLLRSFGAELRPVSPEEGGFVGSIGLAEKDAEAHEAAFLPRQFSNADNSDAHHSTTGPEIHWQLGGEGMKPDALVAGVGTGGTIMGSGRYLRAHHPEVRLHPLEPSNSPTMSTGHRVGKHRIQGISDEFIPDIVDLDALDSIVAVDDGDAIRMAQALANQLGLGVGISSGANLLGAIKLREEMGGDPVVVTLFPDSNKKYLSTDLLHDEPALADHMEPEIELLGFTSINRSCSACDAVTDLLAMGGV